MIDISTYLNRITSQHKTKPNYMALLEARLSPFIDLVRCLESFDEAFDLETAVGRQLDIIGQFVGLNRLLRFQPSGDISPILQDDMYRILLKAKIAQNNWNGTATGMYELWDALFPEYTILIRDNQDMTMTVYTDMSTPFILAQLIQHEYIIPKPMGVRFTYIFLEIDEFTVDDYHAGAMATLIREFTFEEVENLHDGEDFNAGAIAAVIRESFVEYNDILHDGSSYDVCVIAASIVRESFVEYAEILHDGEVYDGAIEQSVFRSWFMEKTPIPETVTAYIGIAVQQNIKEVHTE